MDDRKRLSSPAARSRAALTFWLLAWSAKIFAQGVATEQRQVVHAAHLIIEVSVGFVEKHTYEPRVLAVTGDI